MHHSVVMLARMWIMLYIQFTIKNANKIMPCIIYWTVFGIFKIYLLTRQIFSSVSKTFVVVDLLFLLFSRAISVCLRVIINSKLPETTTAIFCFYLYIFKAAITFYFICNTCTTVVQIKQKFLIGLVSRLKYV